MQNLNAGTVYISLRYDDSQLAGDLQRAVSKGGGAVNIPRSGSGGGGGGGNGMGPADMAARQRGGLPQYFQRDLAEARRAGGLQGELSFLRGSQGNIEFNHNQRSRIDRMVSNKSAQLDSSQFRQFLAEEKAAKRELNDAIRSEARARRDAAKLAGANFQAGISEMSPSGQRRALLNRAGSTEDPMESAMLRRQAGNLHGKTGMNRKLMSTGNYMNFMFGGWEVASSFNAMNAAGSDSARSSSMAQVKAQKAAIDQMGGGILGSMVQGAMNLPDAISRRAGGKGFGWSPFAVNNAIFGAEQSIAAVGAGDERLATSRNQAMASRTMVNSGYAASDPDQYRVSRVLALRGHEDRTKGYDNETAALNDQMATAITQGDQAGYNTALSSYNQRIRNRGAFMRGSNSMYQGQVAGANRAEGLDYAGRMVERGAAGYDAAGSPGMANMARAVGAIELGARAAVGTSFETLARQTANTQLAGLINASEFSIRGHNVQASGVVDRAQGKGLRAQLGDLEQARDAELRGAGSVGEKRAITRKYDAMYDATNREYQQQGYLTRLGLNSELATSGLLASTDGTPSSRAVGAQAMSIRDGAFARSETFRLAGKTYEARVALDIGKNQLKAARNDYIAGIKGEEVNSLANVYLGGKTIPEKLRPFDDAAKGLNNPTSLQAGGIKGWTEDAVRQAVGSLVQIAGDIKDALTLAP